MDKLLCYNLFMKSIKIKCPAKINLTLEILNKRPDGFHNIKSIMQMINLYDYLTINVKEQKGREIKLTGNSCEIPYDSKNLVYKAIDLYLEKSNIKNILVEIYIEKNIPVAAGLAGGSTDAAGTLYGLNCLLNKFNFDELGEMCAELGSDLNVCLNGGCNLATSRGEIVEKIKSINCDVTLIKPKKLGISAGEAYKKYSQIVNKKNLNMTDKMLNAISKNENLQPFLYNDLETAVFDDYKELQEIKQALPNSIMSGSGSTYFVLENISPNLNEDFLVINRLNFINTGVERVD